jgi:hypothetical protein
MEVKCKHANQTLVVTDGFDIYEKTEVKCTDCGAFIKVEISATLKGSPMKIDLKINNDCLQALEQIFKQIKFMPNASPEIKVYTSILLGMSDKIISKAHKANSQMSLFDPKKKHKISFKYHEAFATHQIVNSLNEAYKEDQYKYNLLQKFLHELNQKLC